MNRIHFSLAVFVLATLSVPAYPRDAAGQGVRARGTESAVGRAIPRAGSPPAREIQAPPRAEAQRAAGPSRTAAPSRVPPPRQVGAPRTTAVPRNLPPRAVASPPVRLQARQPQADLRRQSGHPAYRPGYRPQYRPGYRPYYPYYTFQPRVRLGFGLWMGYPVAYPYHYGYGYPYSYPYSYRSPYAHTYTYPRSINSLPGTATVAVSGGLSFDITPPQASVYIDGQYVGTASQYSPDQPPLWLATGRHRVEIREPGFEVVAFDVDIAPGQVIPYHGDLAPF